MNLQWFPGHMAKTRRMISEHLKLVDVVVELLDARLPLSSRNPEIDRIVGNRPRILVLNKADIADGAATEAWQSYFTDRGYATIAVDSQSGKGFSALNEAIDKVMKEKFERDKAKGIQRHSVKMMVVGIPNVGKSSFINRLSGRGATKTGDRPGVTTAKQWIRIAGKYELLDTPGILWPKFENPEVAKRIAFTGGIKDEIIDIEELACELLGYLKVQYPVLLMERFRLEESSIEEEPYDLLETIGRKRGCVISGGNIDTFRASGLVLDDFRSAKIGKISLEFPPTDKDEI
ncbi:MAG: ribosome biogenesis GTPase YlqF [Clostridia bacterium]|nr:ribosome biogenesis GTPase YlqF [Clostridia bacterium]